MKTYLDCYPCFLRQALSAARRAGASTEQQRGIVLETMDRLKGMPEAATPPEMADGIHRLVRARTKNPDPYRRAKEDATEQALALLPRLRELVRASADPLDTALRIAIAGNIIDDGAAERYELEATLVRVLEQPAAVDGRSVLRRALAKVDAVLYLADNAGETVFDRVFIETLSKAVTYVVKAGPIVNDATREDALAAGIDAVAEIIDNGSDAPGTLLARCSRDFRNRVGRAALIIAKGQANYESLSSSTAPICFLLQAKCPVIADDLGVEQGAVVIKASRTLAGGREAR